MLFLNYLVFSCINFQLFSCFNENMLYNGSRLKLRKGCGIGVKLLAYLPDTKDVGVSARNE